MVKNHEDAKDLSQEVNIHIWRKICLYNSESSMFTTWLSRVIRNKVLDLLKQQKKKEIQGVERCLLELWGEDYFDCQFQNEWQKHILKLSRDKVATKVSHRQIKFIKIYLYDAQIPDICEELEINSDNAYKLKERMKSKLKREAANLQFV